MRDALGDAQQRLASRIDLASALPSEPLVADPWIVSSLLQKSIRRGETAIAQQAALTLFKHRGAAIYRRFMVIAFEDVGIGSVDAVTMTVAAGANAAWRKTCGGDLRVAVHLAGILADAPKDRSTDYLCGAKDHPALASFAQAMATARLEMRLAGIGDQTLGLPQQAVAALLAAGCGDGAWNKDGVEGLLGTYHELGVSDELLAAVKIAAARTREPITLLVPLIWLAAKESADITVRDCPVPPLIMAGEIPLHALDEHTRLGREAIWRLAREHGEVRDCLERFVPAGRMRRAANVAAFYADAAPLAKRLVWDQSEALEAFGIERDLLHGGVPAEGIGPLLAAMRANLGQLNELRRQVLARSQGAMVVSP